MEVGLVDVKSGSVVFRLGENGIFGCWVESGTIRKPEVRSHDIEKQNLLRNSSHSISTMGSTTVFPLTTVLWNS